MPAESVQLVPTISTFVLSSKSAVGVNVEVKVTELSADDTADIVPPTMVRSALANEATASEKVIVTREVSPAFRAVSAKVMLLTVGWVLSIVIAEPAVRAVTAAATALPAESEKVHENPTVPSWSALSTVTAAVWWSVPPTVA